MNNIIPQEEKNRIDDICTKYGITNYIINSDGTIDVDGDVMLNGKSLTTLPLRFNKVNGNFACYGNELTSLTGCPKEVSASFYCFGNQLTSLDGFPQKIGGAIHWNNNLFPEEFLYIYYSLQIDHKKIFLKYQSYYDVWTPDFDWDNTHALIDDIKDGFE
jgi:hypothetical protein